MKKHFLLGIISCCFFILTSCAHRDFYKINNDLLHETWLQQINTNPNIWRQQYGDSWFLSGAPNNVERSIKASSDASTISLVSVRSPNFTNVEANGTFQIQIVGGQKRNSVYVLGPNKQIRQVVVETKGNTLYLRQMKRNLRLNNIIVRIGICNLRRICNSGCGGIEGKGIRSDILTILSTGEGNILLSGKMNLGEVRQLGGGVITVMGAHTPALNIRVFGHGCVNVSGCVGVQSIRHRGNGTINIIGADTDFLNIAASGCGLITVVGYANLRRVTAIGSSRVYVYWVDSVGTYVNVRNQARVGLAGRAINLNVDTHDESRFEGQFLRGANVYASTLGWSHANVRATSKLFAAAGNRSSIYFFGAPCNVTRYMSQGGVVLPAWYEPMPYRMPPLRPKRVSNTHNW